MTTFPVPHPLPQNYGPLAVISLSARADKYGYVIDRNGIAVYMPSTDFQRRSPGPRYTLQTMAVLL